MNKTEMNERIREIVGQLTLEEKVRMIHGDALFYSGDVERLHIPAVHMSDGPMGVRCEFPRASWIPVGNSDDYVTYCPSNSAIAATWNPELAYKVGQVLGEETRGRGKDMILGPGINIKRVPANGRNFEYMSEDPHLISELVVPLIEGIQESDVAACVKHFALNNQETERLWVNVEIDERALREIYLPGFEAAVKKGNAHAIMGAYNLMRGVHCCENQELLGEILRKEWKFDGVIVSDWSAVHHTKAAAESPLDIEMSVTYDFDDYKMARPLLEAVRKGEVDEACIDEKVANILRMMIRPKMLEAAGRKAGCYNTPEHREKVRKVAEEAIILLKNEEDILPLQPEQTKELLIIGDNAERLHALGGGSAEIKALYEISPLMGIKSQLGGNTKVTFARGYCVSPKEEAEVNWQETSTEEGAMTKLKEEREQVSAELMEKRKALREEAVNLAQNCENVIIIAGLNHDYDVEGYDRDTMELPYEQDLLIEEVLKVAPNAVVVMRAGNPVSMGKWKDKAKAIVWEYYSGMEAGNVLAGILFGKVNPSGKLPETIPYCMEDCGAIQLGEFPGRALTEEEKQRMDAHTTVEYKDGIYVGYRYYEKYQVPVQFCFGHGLSYTAFTYGDVSVTKEVGNALAVTFSIKNVGTVAGMETAQVYVGKKESNVDRPVKELKGFKKVFLQPGEEKKVSISLSKDAFTYYDVKEKAFVVEPGTYQIYVARSLDHVEKVIEIPVS